jgi:hypothetical protein
MKHNNPKKVLNTHYMTPVLLSKHKRELGYRRLFIGLRTKHALQLLLQTPFISLRGRGEESKKNISGCHLPHSLGQNLSITVASLGEQIPSTCS